MVQGKSNFKGAAKSTSARKQSKAAATTKKGQRVAPPKKASAVKHKSLMKKLSAPINNSIEQQMVAKASTGKLTIMKNNGKEESEKDGKKGKGKA